MDIKFEITVENEKQAELFLQAIQDAEEENRFNFPLNIKRVEE